MAARNSMRRGAAVIVAGVILVAPTACSSSDRGGAAADTSPVRIVIEGQPQTVDGTTVCTNGPTGEVTIEVDPPGTAAAATSPDPIVMLDLTPQGDTPSVSLLAIHLPDIRLSAGRYRNSGVPTATKSGSAYTVKGQATVVGTPPDRPEYRSFELELACP